MLHGGFDPPNRQLGEAGDLYIMFGSAWEVYEKDANRWHSRARWFHSQRGPAGEKGPQGDPGPEGPPGEGFRLFRRRTGQH